MANKNTERVVDLVINGQKSKASLAEIKTAVSALTREFGKMREADDPEAYNKKKLAVQKLKQEYREMNNEVNNVNTSSQKFLTNFKTIASGVIGANLVTGFFMGVRSAIDGSIDAITRRSDEVADIMKTTGLANDEVKALDKQLGSIDTRTGRSELRKLAVEAGKLGNESAEDIKKFVEEANIINVALGEDLGDDAIIQISKASKQFNEGMLNIASGINAVGAASEAQEGYLVDFMARVAPLAQVADLAAGDVLGYAATLDQAGLKVEMSATAINTFYGDFIKNTEEFGKVAGMAKGELEAIAGKDGYNEAFLQMLTQLKDANPEAKDFLARLEEMGINGARGSSVFLSLANNIDNVRANQALANEEIKKGTSVLDEYDIRNENAAANYEKALKKLRAGLKPYITILGEASIAFLTFVSNNVKGIMVIAKVLIVGTTAWVGYKVAVILSDKANLQFVRNLLKTQTALRLQKLATVAAAAAQALFSGKIGRASAAMRVFNTTTKMNPVGLLIGVLTAAVTAFSLFRTSVEKAKTEQKEFNEAAAAGQAILKNTTDLENQVNVRKKLSKEQLEEIKRNLKSELDALESKTTKVITLQNKEAANAKSKISKEVDGKSKGVGPAIKPGMLAAVNISKRMTSEKMLTDHLENQSKEREGINMSEIASSKKKLQENLLLIEQEIKTRPVTKTKLDDTKTESNEVKEKELKEIVAGFAKIEDAVKKHRDNLAVLTADEELKEAEKINQKYKNELLKLTETNKLILESDQLTEKERLLLMETYTKLELNLLTLHDDEIQALEDAQNAERVAKEDIKKTKAEKETKADNERLRLSLMTDSEIEIDRINKFYDNIEELAKGNAEAMIVIAKKRAAELAGVSYKEAETAVAAAAKKRTDLIDIATSTSAILTDLANLTARQGQEMTAFQKAAAVVQIITNQAIALSNALATSTAPTVDNIATGGLSGLVKFAIISASILSTAAQVKGALSSTETPTAPQFYGGGLTVRGAEDGRKYSGVARSIAGGGAVSTASIGILGERGPEYVIPNTVYSNPANADLMTAIASTVDSSSKGGSTAIGGGNNAEVAAAMRESTAANKMLIKILSEGITANTYLSLQELEDAQKSRNASQSVAVLG
jgi:hypothetical protein